MQYPSEDVQLRAQGDKDTDQDLDLIAQSQYQKLWECHQLPRGNEQRKTGDLELSSDKPHIKGWVKVQEVTKEMENKCSEVRRQAENTIT